MRHLLVTNDFPPKIGGIQSYLWELWRRLPPEDVTVLTTPYAGDTAFDAQQAFRVVRTKQRWLLPTGALVRQINALAEEVGAEVIVLDPVVPLGILGPKLHVPYVVVAHGAEYVIPAGLPVARRFIRRVTGAAIGAIAGGAYVGAAVRAVANASRTAVTTGPAIIEIPPGVDVGRFVPFDEIHRAVGRRQFDIAADATLVVGVSRLVPRKGFDRLVRAAAVLRFTHPDLVVAIAGKGRHHKRLAALIEQSGAPVHLLGRVSDDDLPTLYGAADVFCMPCHDRWFGLEREGFGIVFVEAAAAGLPSVAGASGGSAEAVVHEHTGLVIPGQAKPDQVAAALGRLLDDRVWRRTLGEQGRVRATELFSYDHLAGRLQDFLIVALRSGR